MYFWATSKCTDQSASTVYHSLRNNCVLKKELDLKTSLLSLDGLYCSLSGKSLAASTAADCVEYGASADERQKPLPVFEHDVIFFVCLGFFSDL